MKTRVGRDSFFLLLLRPGACLSCVPGSLGVHEHSRLLFCCVWVTFAASANSPCSLLGGCPRTFDVFVERGVTVLFPSRAGGPLPGHEPWRAVSRVRWV